MEVVKTIDYEDPQFAERARKLISAGHPFAFQVSGPAFEQLKPFLSGGEVKNIIGLGRFPKLHPLSGVLQFSQVKGRSVKINESGDHVLVHVGLGQG